MEDTDKSDQPSASEDFSENDEAEMNNSSLLEKRDIENKMTEIPPETIIPPKANTVKCLHCGKSYNKNFKTKNPALKGF